MRNPDMFSFWEEWSSSKPVLLHNMDRFIFFCHSINKWMYCKYKENILINIVVMSPGLLFMQNYLLLCLVRFSLLLTRDWIIKLLLFLQINLKQPLGTKFTKYYCVKCMSQFFQTFKNKRARIQEKPHYLLWWVPFYSQCFLFSYYTFFPSANLFFFLLEDCSFHFRLLVSPKIITSLSRFQYWHSRKKSSAGCTLNIDGGLYLQCHRLGQM
jgi:hypothetical protein